MSSRWTWPGRKWRRRRDRPGRRPVVGGDRLHRLLPALVVRLDPRPRPHEQGQGHRRDREDQRAVERGHRVRRRDGGLGRRTAVREGIAMIRWPFGRRRGGRDRPASADVAGTPAAARPPGQDQAWRRLPPLRPTVRWRAPVTIDVAKEPTAVRTGWLPRPAIPLGMPVLRDMPVVPDTPVARDAPTARDVPVARDLRVLRNTRGRRVVRPSAARQPTPRLTE